MEEWTNKKLKKITSYCLIGIDRLWRCAGVGPLGQSTRPQPCCAHTRLCEGRVRPVATVQQKLGVWVLPLPLLHELGCKWGHASPFCAAIKVKWFQSHWVWHEEELQMTAASKNRKSQLLMYVILKAKLPTQALQQKLLIQSQVLSW